jgi:hypothetical protein
LLDDGWTEENLSKLASGNIIRVLAQVENVNYIQFDIYNYDFKIFLSKVFYIRESQATNR